MKLHKFVGKKDLILSKKERDLVDKLHPKNFIREGDYLFTQLDNVSFKSKHNYWGTGNKDREFNATAKKVMIFIHKKEGVIENIPGTEGTISYSISIKTYGDMRYKYQRGVSTNTEIYSFYDYNDNLEELLERAVDYYNEEISFINKQVVSNKLRA